MPSESHSRFEPKLTGGAHPRSATMLRCVGVRCRNLRDRHRAKWLSGREGGCRREPLGLSAMNNAEASSVSTLLTRRAARRRAS